jgi:hypothetical protein
MRPKDFAKAISANVPPKGLVDFSASKPEELLKAAKEKADEKKRSILDDLKQDRDDFKELKAEACIAEVDPYSKDNVGSGACDVDCQEALNKKDCPKGDALDPILDGLADYSKFRSDSENSKISEKFTQASKAIRDLDQACVTPEEKKLCLVCVSTKSKDFVNRTAPGYGNSNSADEYGGTTTGRPK